MIFHKGGAQSFLFYKNQLCYDFSIPNSILNFVQKYSSKLNIQTQSLLS